eukprot:gene10714-11861_t
MEISEEEENCFRLSKLFYNDIPVHLRTLFKDKWDGKHPTDKWDDKPASGALLINEINKFHQGFLKRSAYLEKKFKEGDNTKWDVTALCGAILNSDLQLSDREKNTIIQIRDIRNKHLGHVSFLNISDEDIKKLFADVEKAYKFFGWATSGLYKIRDGSLTTKEITTLRNQIDRERKEAIKNNPKNFHNLPGDIQNYVGRKEEMKNLLHTVECKEGYQVILIHGGPCYGKSAFATQFGYEMVEKGCNYVIWTDMRSIVHDSSAPNVESLAMRILGEFDIDVDDCEEKAQKYLEMKCKSIRKNNKQLLIILDNADSMLGIDENSNDTTDVYKMIKDLTSDCVKVALTSRSSRLMDVQKVQIKPFTESEGKMYLESTLAKNALMDRDDLVERLNACSHGMPLALKILVNAVNNAEDSQYLQDYLNDVENKTITTLDEEHPIMHLFEISFKYLQNEELELIKMLAVYPSAFSFNFVKILAHQFKIKDVRKLLNAIKKKGLLEVTAGTYYFHPLFLEYIKETQWSGKDEEKFHKCFIEVYITAMIDLGMKSLKKDAFSECLNEAKIEKSNFLYVMDLVKRERTSGLNVNTFNKTANEYVAMILFLNGFIYGPILIDFLKTCETLASDESKYYAYCCHYVLCKKILKNEYIQEPNEQEVLDDEGKRCCTLLLKRRQLVDEVHSKHERRTDEVISKHLERLLDEAKQLSDSNLASYFKLKFLKLFGLFYKNVKKSQESSVSYYREALDIALDVFGKHPFTFDCYVQIAKCYWRFKLFKEANECFELAKCFAESMSMQDVKQYANYLLVHGRCLIDSKVKENEQQGVALLEQSLETCDDTHSIFFASAITYLMRIDATYYNTKLLPYFYDLEDPSGNICDSLTGSIMFSKDISELLRASCFLGKVLEKNKVWSKKRFKQMKALLEWNNMIFDHPDVSDYSVKAEANKDRVIYLAEEALSNCNCPSIWASIVIVLCSNDVKYYEYVLPYFKKQEQPCKALSLLVKDKFIIEMNGAYCKIDQYDIERSSTKAVSEMQEAITHLEYISNNTDGQRRSFCMKSLYFWNKLGAETTLVVKDRQQFASKALFCIKEGAEEKSPNKIENLRKIQISMRLMLPADKMLETLIVRKVLLKMISGMKIPKNQRDNLEKDYWRLLGDSMKSTNLHVKANIIKDAFEVAGMSIQTYQRYLEVLFQLLSSAESGVFEWQYKVFINYLPKLLSFDGFDQTQLHPGVKIGRKILTHLNGKHRFHFKNERMVQFEILYIMAICTEERLDVSKRIAHAKDAISLFERVKEKDDLQEKMMTLTDFVASNIPIDLITMMINDSGA